MGACGSRVVRIENEGAKRLRMIVDDCGLRGFGGSGSGLHHTPPKTHCCRNLCGCGVIFVVRTSTNPEMGVEANHPPCKSSSQTKSFCCPPKSTKKIATPDRSMPNLQRSTNIPWCPILLQLSPFRALQQQAHGDLTDVCCNWNLHIAVLQHERQQPQLLCGAGVHAGGQQ